MVSLMGPLELSRGRELPMKKKYERGLLFLGYCMHGDWLVVVVLGIGQI